MKYSRSLKDYRDWHNTLNYAIEEKTAQISKKLLAKGRKEGIAIGLKTGREEGREEGRGNTQKEIAMRLLDMQMEVKKIAQISDLTIEEILALKK
jgi:predicted transposase/invertase (TIGR01784 family)